MKNLFSKIFLINKPAYNFKGKYRALDVANYVVRKSMQDGRPISNLQLQKILYYIQVYFIQTEHRALFSDEIEAWKHGPVVRSVYNRYCVFGAADIYEVEKTTVRFSDSEYNIINKIVEEKRNLKPWDLVEDTHQKGKAWSLIYRNGLGERKIIPKGVIAQYG